MSSKSQTCKKCVNTVLIGMTFHVSQATCDRVLFIFVSLPHCGELEVAVTCVLPGPFNLSHADTVPERCERPDAKRLESQ